MTAMNHIQKIAPGPPDTIAIAMPAILPTPTRDAVLTQNAWKGEISFPSVFVPAVFAISLNIVPK